MTHSGELKNDSPALFGELKRRFSPDELNQLTAAYRQCFANNGLDEGAVKRDEGVSFNPKPARIALILLKEFPKAGVSEVMEVFGAVPKRSPAVVLAELIDELRHLHMTPLNTNQIKERAITAREILKSHSSQELGRLRLVAEAAMYNLLRIYE